MPSEAQRWKTFICPQDFVWFLLFGALVANPDPRYADAPEFLPLIALGIAQILEPKIPALASPRGRMAWILLKLVLAYTLIGETGSVTSRYWLMLLLPVVSAATALGVVGTLGFTVLAAGSYLSFLVWTSDWVAWLPDLVYRVIFLAMAGNLANTLAEDLRVQSRKHRRTAEQLAEANAHLHDAEEAVRRSDRLAALGQLSAGLAHELRNPLATIRNSSEMLTRNIGPQNEVAAEMAGFIVTEVDRANSLITRFLHFARPLQLRPDVADLHHTIDNAIAMVDRETPGVSIYRNYAPEIPPFSFDAELLERVFYNLIMNAAQATEPGGTVTVKTRTAPGVAEIAVIDRGSGIDPKHMETIFNPFFTTKPQGVGLGLAIVSKIVDEHGGKITVESEPGKGSIFRVLLPMQPAAAIAT